MSCRTSTWVDLRQNRHAKRCGPIRLRLPGLVPLLLWKLRFVIYYLRRVICFAAGNVLPTPTYKQGKETNLIMNSDICDWFCTLDFGWVWCWSSVFFHGGHFDLYLKVLLRAAFTSALWNISQHIKPYENLRQLCIAWPLSYHGCWQHFWVQFVKRAMLQFRSAWFSKFYYCSAVIIAGIFFCLDTISSERFSRRSRWCYGCNSKEHTEHWEKAKKVRLTYREMWQLRYITWRSVVADWKVALVRCNHSQDSIVLRAQERCN